MDYNHFIRYPFRLYVLKDFKQQKDKNEIITTFSISGKNHHEIYTKVE